MKKPWVFYTLISVVAIACIFLAMLSYCPAWDALVYIGKWLGMMMAIAGVAWLCFAIYCLKKLTED